MLSWVIFYDFLCWAQSDVYDFPRIIWTYWDQNPPEDVGEMIESAMKSLTKFKYNYITLENLTSFIIDFPPGFENLPPQNKADFIRLFLLEKHGGVWIDASMYVNSGDVMEFFFSESVKVKSQFSAFGTFPFPMTFFFGAPRNSSYIKYWLNEFRNAMGMGFEAYRQQAYERFPNIKHRNAYHTLDLSWSYALLAHEHELRSIPKMFINTNNNKHSPLKLHHECGFKPECIKKSLVNEANMEKYSLIKLGRKERFGKRIKKKKVVAKTKSTDL